MSDARDSLIIGSFSASARDVSDGFETEPQLLLCATVAGVEVSDGFAQEGYVEGKGSPVRW
jgi:hypothetical protein